MGNINKINLQYLLRLLIGRLTLAIFFEITAGAFLYVTLHSVNSLVNFGTILFSSLLIIVYIYIDGIRMYFRCRGVSNYTYKTFSVLEKSEISSILNNEDVHSFNGILFDKFFIFRNINIITIVRYEDILSVRLLYTSKQKRDSDLTEGTLEIIVRTGKHIKKKKKLYMKYIRRDGEIINMIFKLKDRNPSIETL